MFCKFCGSELNDNAVVCIKCGCAIDRSNRKKKDKKERNSSISFERKTTIFNYLSVAFLSLSMLFFLLSVADPYIGYGYFMLNYIHRDLGVLLGLIGSGLSIANFIMRLINKKTNSSFETNVILMISIAILALSIVLATF